MRDGAYKSDKKEGGKKREKVDYEKGEAKKKSGTLLVQQLA